MTSSHIDTTTVFYIWPHYWSQEDKKFGEQRAIGFDFGKHIEHPDGDYLIRFGNSQTRELAEFVIRNEVNAQAEIRNVDGEPEHLIRTQKSRTRGGSQ